MEELMVDVMYDISAVGAKAGSKLVITATMVEAQLSDEGQLVDLIRKAN